MKIAAVILLAVLSVSAQVKTRPTPAKIPASVPVKVVAPSVDPGKVAGRTYSNEGFGFEVTFPDSWLIPDSDFEAKMRKQGFDMRAINMTALGPASLAQFKKQVTLLLTAYRSMPGTPDNTTALIAVEDLKPNSQIKDAVDYLDAVRSGLIHAKLPASFVVGDTQAEQLGAMQFGYLDTSSGKQKRRMYATVRRGYAIIFTLAYTEAADLATFREVLEKGNFRLAASASPTN